MRLRLDKLVLSAGLALAMVATTIPVGATVTTETSATPGYTLNGEAATSAKVAKAVAGDEVEEGTAASKVGITYGSTVVVTLPEPLPEPGAVGDITDANLTTYLGTDLIAEKKFDATGVKVKVVETKTYKLKDYKYIKANEENLSVEEANALAAATAALKEVAGANSTNNPTTGGTYDVVVKSVEGTATYNNGDGTNTSLSTENIDAAATVDTILVNGLTLEVEKTYTITNLAALGMTYDVVFADSANAKDNLVYSVIKYDGETPSEVESTKVSNGTVASLTDLTATYYLVKKTVSVKSDLITKTTYTGSDYGVTISDDTGAIGNITPAGKTAIDKYVSDNSATLINYLYINVVANNASVSATSTPITFTIDVPVDVESGVTYKVLRYHDLKVDVLDTTVADGVITFSSDLFSDFALVTVAADTTTTEEETNNETESATESATEAGTEAGTTTAGSSTTSTTTSTKTADNSMMPLFMTTLLLALCAGSLAIYKEKKTN